MYKYETLRFGRYLVIKEYWNYGRLGLVDILDLKQYRSMTSLGPVDLLDLKENGKVWNA